MLREWLWIRVLLGEGNACLPSLKGVGPEIRMFTLNGTTVTWTLVALLLVTTVFIRNFYCRYLCPVGAALGLMSQLSVFRIKRWKQCNTCKLCQKACEWGAIQGPKIAVSECVRCDDCEILYSSETKCPHWLMINKKDWLRIVRAGEPTFKNIAHYLGSEEGTVWRQERNITTVATADELLAW